MEVPSDQEDAIDGEQLKKTAEISISIPQMKSFLKYDNTAEDGPLITLEKRLEVGFTEPFKPH